jgi:hypothetical protein
MPVIPATQGEEIGRIVVQGQPRQEVPKTLSQPIKNWVWWYTPVIPAKHHPGQSWHKLKTLFEKSRMQKGLRGAAGNDFRDRAPDPVFKLQYYRNKDLAGSRKWECVGAGLPGKAYSYSL